MAGCIAEIKAAHGALPLVALHDTDVQHGPDQWRCYSPTSLDASKTRYTNGKLYCTHDAALGDVLEACPETTLWENGANATSCFRIPNVIRIDGGVLLAFAEARRLSCSDSGPKALAMRRSTDSGATWEPTRFLVEDPATLKDGLNLGASVYDATTKQVFVHYGVCGHTCRPAGTTFVLASSDLGETWTRSNLTAMVVAAGWGMINAGPGTGVQLASGRLAVAVWGRRLSAPGEAEGGVAALLSDDHGASWRLGAPVLADARHAPNECQLAALTDGSLLMNVRDARNNGCHCRLTTTSANGGDAWSTFEEVPTLTGPICQASMISVRDGGNATGGGVGGGKAVLFFSGPQYLEGRQDGYIKASVDEGETFWLRGSRLDDAAQPGFAYSGLVDLGSSSSSSTRVLGVVYEAVGRVVFKIVTVDYSDLLPSVKYE